MAQKILVVEDEDFIRELYKRQLTLAGFTVDSLNSADAAEIQITQNAYDLILLDIMMPGNMNGIELLKKLKQNELTKQVSVVILTNLGLDDLVKEAMAAGARGFLVKANFTPDQIVAEVKKYLGDTGVHVPNPSTPPDQQ